ncbi:MAG: hypothetical protein NTX07_03160, partial [Solirubrobacterales bacterium]|nr:hypothetical protein [Solirubrobacterales bacterium]
AQSGSRITGELELLDDPCGWGDSSLRLVTVVADGEGQMAAPIEVSLENSKYFHTVKDADGAWQSEYIPTGCSFNNSYYRTQVYYRQGGVLKKVVKAGKKAVPTTFTATS